MAGKKDPNLDYTYKDKITYVCPVRGTVTQEVIVKKYKYLGTPVTRLTSEELEELMKKYGIEEEPA